jgi:SAM-dependent methyltransferase
MLKDNEDAFGHGMFDYYHGTRTSLVIERDDGYFEPDVGLQQYFTEFRSWHHLDRQAMRYVRGRVLDIGCGAGKHSLYLQQKGLDVVGIDNSPLAIEVCKLRGLRDARPMSINQIGRRLGVFDTVLMLGNNFGLFGSPDRAKRLLRRLRRMTSRRGRIIAQSVDPYRTDNPDHLKYHERNRQRGRMAGQIRLRVRYRKYANPWWDLLFVSKQEMADILDGTGWRANVHLETQAGPYIAILEKTKP